MNELVKKLPSAMKYQDRSGDVWELTLMEGVKLVPGGLEDWVRVHGKTPRGRLFMSAYQPTADPNALLEELFSDLEAQGP